MLLHKAAQDTHLDIVIDLKHVWDAASFAAYWQTQQCNGSMVAL